jgi:hypothetical protein
LDCWRSVGRFIEEFSQIEMRTTDLSRVLFEEKMALGSKRPQLMPGLLSGGIISPSVKRQDTRAAMFRKYMWKMQTK